MSETIQDLYESFSEQMAPIQEDDRYFRYLFEMARASDTTVEQKREELEKVVDEEWLDVIEGSLDAINAIIEKPRRFITTEEEVVPVSLAKKISSDSVRHLAQNTQFLAPSDDGGVHPTRILNVNNVETYDLYENRFVYHLIQRLLAFVDKRTDVIFWSTGNEVCNHFKMHSRIEDAYEEIEYTVEMRVKNRQSFAENDADNVGTFMRIDRVRRLVMSLGKSSFCQLMAGCSKVRSPIQRTNLIVKDPNYRKCYQLWQFIERYDQVGYTINVKDSEMAFDDEYLIQMYTNLINNYTVFKSLAQDERRLEEVEGVEREPVRPKFVKEIQEELVADPDLPDVEVRRVFVEEVTQAQLDAEVSLDRERAEGERLRAEVQRLRREAGVLAAERDEQKRAADAARAEAGERVAAAQEDAAAKVAAAQEDAVARVEAAQAEAAGQVTAAQADAAAKVAAAQEDAAARVSAAEESAAAQVAEARREASERIAAADEAANRKLADARADARRELEDTRASSEKALDEVRASLARKTSELEDSRAQADAARESAALELEQARAVAAAELDAARGELERARAKAASDLDDARRKLDEARKQAASELDAALKKADQKRDAQVREARDEMQERVSSLIRDLERAERARAHAQKRADANSLSRYLLNKLRGLEDEGDRSGEDVAGGSDDGDSR